MEYVSGRDTDVFTDCMAFLLISHFSSSDGNPFWLGSCCGGRLLSSLSLYPLFGFFGRVQLAVLTREGVRRSYLYDYPLGR